MTAQGRPATSSPPLVPPDVPDPVYERLCVQLRPRLRLRVFRERLHRAQDVVRAALERGPAAVSFSGGKDSTALLHLVRSVDPSVPAFFVDDGGQLPWAHGVVEAMRQRGHAVTRLETVISLPDMLRMVGMLGYRGPKRLPGEWHWTVDQFRWVLVDEPAQRIRDMGYRVQFVGLRAEESGARRVNRAMRGLIYEREDGIVVATPIADWEGIDVLAYLVHHRLPVSPQYLQPDDPERYTRRMASVYLEQAADAGDWSRFRELLPAFWQEITRDFPGMRKRS